ncbi:MAG TPA: hypothetical protein VHB97_17095 [Polyangia bacterium]|nr:hypothetical protein [Polyangia bacterium]
MPSRSLRWILAGCLVVAIGCKKSSDLNATHEMPKLPPPPTVPLGALHIDVEIDGKPARPIDAALLESTKPDFADAERKAWRLATVIGPAAARPGAVAEVTGDKNVAIVFASPANDTDPLPVLTQTRRGTIVAAMVDPADAFPPYHGQGRRMARPGDPLPRVSGVTKIRSYVPASAPHVP